jgi:hypothetical protein
MREACFFNHLHTLTRFLACSGCPSGAGGKGKHLHKNWVARQECHARQSASRCTFSRWSKLTSSIGFGEGASSVSAYDFEHIDAATLHHVIHEPLAA